MVDTSGRIVHPLFPNSAIRTVSANEEISYLKKNDCMLKDLNKRAKKPFKQEWKVDAFLSSLRMSI